MKKMVLFAIVCFPVALGAFKIPDSVPKPSATLKSFDIESISLRDVNFLFNFDIKNPYPVPLKLDDVKFTFFVEKNQLFSTNTGKGLSIKAKGTKLNTFRVNLKYADIIKIIKDYGKKDMLDCRIDVAIVIPLPKIKPLPKNITFDYTVNTKIPAIKPVINVANFKVKKPSLSDITAALKKKGSKADASSVADMFSGIFSGKSSKQVVDPASLDIPIDVDFDIVLKNETAHKLLFKDLDYDFFVAGEPLVKGITKDIRNEGNTSIIRVSSRFSSKALGKSVLAVFDKQKGDFGIKGNTFLKLPDSVKKDPLKLSFDEKGTFNTK